MNRAQPYPKVLLVCNFNQSTANGITIRNLFQNWPKDRIAVAEFSGRIECVYTEGISQYYCLGEMESKFLWPFNLLSKPNSSRSYFLEESPKDSKPKQKPILKKRLFLKVIALRLKVAFLQLSGLVLVSRKYFFSTQFDRWVMDFKPDVIYTSISDINKAHFVLEMRKRYNVKLTVHIFDDFLNTKHQYSLFSNYWKSRLEITARRLFSESDLCLAISEKMSREYKEKYKRDFHPFHNPLDPKIWTKERATSTTIERSNSFTFVYTGKINRDTAKPLSLFIKALERLQALGYGTQLEIYTATGLPEVLRLLGNINTKIIKGFIKNNELPIALRKADGLFFPLDSSRKTRNYVRLSIATKATEYMISGRPIFVFAPRDIAVVEYLQEHDAAYIVSSLDRLEKATISFIENTRMRKRIAKNAELRAKGFHLTTIVNEQLRSLLKQVSDTV